MRQSQPVEPPRRFSKAPFRVQRWLLSRVPPLTNDRIHRYGLLVIAFQLPGFCALTFMRSAESPAYRITEIGLVSLGAAALALAFGVVAVLVFAGDAFPEQYARIVNVRERLHPVTMNGLALLLCAELLCFASFATLAQEFDPRAFSHCVIPPSPFEFLYFAIVTGFTVGYGDIVPQTTLARGLAVSQILVTSLMIIGLVGVLVSSYVSRLWFYRDYLAELGAKKETGKRDADA